MIPEVYSDLIDRLLKRTDDKQINWVESKIDGGPFVHFSASSIELQSFMDESNNRVVLFLVRNSSGEEIDRFEADFRDDEYRAILDMYDLAVRAARGIEDVVKNIILEMDG